MGLYMIYGYSYPNPRFYNWINILIIIFHLKVILKIRCNYQY